MIRPTVTCQRCLAQMQLPRDHEPDVDVPVCDACFFPDKAAIRAVVRLRTRQARRAA